MYKNNQLKKWLKRRSKRSSGFKKSVAKIAKNVVMRTAETKTASINWTGDVGTNGRLFTVWDNITQGTGQQNRIGDRIRSLGIRLRGYYAPLSGVITAGANDLVSYRVVIFTAKRPISSITDSGLTYFGNVDPELITVLSDRYFRFYNDGRGNTVNRYIKCNRVVDYNPSGATPSKNELYVALLCQQFGVSGMTATQGVYSNINVQPYFKDI